MTNFSKPKPKKRRFPRNDDIFGYMGKKRFLKVISAKLLFSKMLIFLDIAKKRPFQSDLKKRNFSQNVDIFEHMDNRFSFQRNLKSCTLNFDIFGQKKIFPKWSQKNIRFHWYFQRYWHNFRKWFQTNVIFPKYWYLRI